MSCWVGRAILPFSEIKLVEFYKLEKYLAKGPIQVCRDSVPCYCGVDSSRDGAAKSPRGRGRLPFQSESPFPNLALPRDHRARPRPPARSDADDATAAAAVSALSWLACVAGCAFRLRRLCNNFMLPFIHCIAVAAAAFVRSFVRPSVRPFCSRYIIALFVSIQRVTASAKLASVRENERD